MFLFIQLVQRRLFPAVVTLAACGITAGVTLVWNFQLGRIINSVSAGVFLSYKTICLAFFTLGITFVFTYFKGYISGYLCEIITHDLRMGYARYFASLSIPETENLNTGQELSKLQNEIADVSAYINANLIQLADDIIKFIATLIWFSTIKPGLVLLANGPCIVIIVYVFFSSKIIGSAVMLSQQDRGRMNKFADNLLALFPVIKLYNASAMMIADYDREIGEWEKHTIKAETVQARLMSLSGLLSTVPLMILLLAGGGMVIKGTLTIGTLYVFLNLSGNVSGVMMNMPGYIAAFRRFSSNMKLLGPKILFTGK